MVIICSAVGDGQHRAAAMPTATAYSYLIASIISVVARDVSHPDLQLRQHCSRGTLQADGALHHQSAAGTGLQCQVHGIWVQGRGAISTFFISDHQLDAAGLT